VSTRGCALRFPDDRQTARFANLDGLENWRLLDAAEAAGLEVLITADQNIRSTEFEPKEYRPRNSVWADQPIERSCARRAGGDLRDSFDQGWGRGKDSVTAGL